MKRAAVLPARCFCTTASRPASPAYGFALKDEVNRQYKRGWTHSSQKIPIWSSPATIGTDQPVIGTSRSGTPSSRSRAPPSKHTRLHKQSLRQR